MSILELTTTDRRDRVAALELHQGAKPKGHVLGRCHACDVAYAVKGAGARLEMLACPVCGLSLAQTTSHLRAGFRIVDDRDAFLRELMIRLGINAAIEDRATVVRRYVDRVNADRDSYERGDFYINERTGSPRVNFAVALDDAPVLEQVEAYMKPVRALERKAGKLHAMKVAKSGLLEFDRLEAYEAPALRSVPETREPLPGADVGDELVLARDLTFQPNTKTKVELKAGDRVRVHRWHRSEEAQITVATLEGGGEYDGFLGTINRSDVAREGLSWEARDRAIGQVADELDGAEIELLPLDESQTDEFPRWVDGDGRPLEFLPVDR